ncbi:DUF881 domain-containing protein [Clostridium chauvoei]|uniref:Division initiation protein n=2 Tax=Clostridium chauvoei TaxID=46867 RepID=S6FA16_9CLOT|nr:DUF881 domain-containing protein [Clostridium chauvoei]ATD55223.1 division initiation protein [Clostridium chauvoei]ATD57105.1 division initiation protein [Clostridium chauvoei]MBX7279567.1 DUF881 domain-containing protein [Clostridium chauvoei]MBX7281936.1 DUF881 domain-containing protein [Clostridium chauvoei]MBX7284475.1 DUF881 domain-containing protein [Clostridium chauvoei]
MKRATSQIVVAVVCALLGFLLAHQFKLLNKKEQTNLNSQNSNIIAEIDSLKKEKEELMKSNGTLLEQLKTLEEAAAKKGEVEGEVKKQLDNARMHLGLVDVKGPGMTITITPKTNIFGSSGSDSARDISEEELVHIVNLLWYSRAEAISINDFRITPQTGIKNSGNYIWISSVGKIDPKDKIVIKVIGEKEKLNVGMTFPGSLDYAALQNYNAEVKTSDDIVINKTTQSLKSEFIKPIN